MQKDFPLLTKADWLQQVQKDLKGAELSTLDWAVSGTLQVSPLVAASDVESAPAPIPAPETGWEIDEWIRVEDPATANAQAMQALEFGAEGLTFYLSAAPDAASFETLFQGIHLDFIGLHFEGPGAVENPGLILVLLQGVAASHGIEVQKLYGSIAYDPVSTAAIVDWRYLAELIQLATVQFPGFRLIQLREKAGLSPEIALSDILKQANHYMDHLQKTGLSKTAIVQSLQVQFQTGTLYFVEIARHRAFRLLWLNWCKAWDLPLVYPDTSAVFAAEAYTDEIYTNMIRATTMAMSAALGGARRITVAPCDTDRQHLSQQSPAFARRIARNVQHLLKMESGIAVLNDPASGSYYIENLTVMLAKKAWTL